MYAVQGRPADGFCDSITIHHNFSVSLSTLARKYGLTEKLGDYYVKEVTVADAKEYSTFTETKVKDWTMKYSVLNYAYDVFTTMQ